MAYLEVRGVTKIYEANGASVPALQNVSFSAERGEWIALTGRSGCGKSTLLNLCGAMDFPTEGVVSIGGQITTELNDNAVTKLRRNNVGFVFQSFQLLHTLSVIENVELPLQLAGAGHSRKAARELLAWVGLRELSDRLPHQLSGGQQQRVAIARALVHNPSIVLADEPTGNLDTASGETILSLLQRITRESKALVVMATHSLEAAADADRVVRMSDGRIVEEQSKEHAES
jgi:ABC-type lipoprotein export system ATPase subunit